MAPLDTGGVPITGYYIQYRIRGTASYDIKLSQPQPTEATITGLRLGTTYQVRLATLTAIGIGNYCCSQSGSQVFARTRDGKLTVLRVIMKYICINYVYCILYDIYILLCLWTHKSQPRCPGYQQFLV